jgi:hypothetical protein
MNFWVFLNQCWLDLTLQEQIQFWLEFVLKFERIPSSACSRIFLKFDRTFNLVPDLVLHILRLQIPGSSKQICTRNIFIPFLWGLGMELIKVKIKCAHWRHGPKVTIVCLMISPHSTPK